MSSIFGSADAKPQRNNRTLSTKRTMYRKKLRNAGVFSFQGADLQDLDLEELQLANEILGTYGNSHHTFNYVSEVESGEMTENHDHSDVSCVEIDEKVAKIFAIAFICGFYAAKNDIPCPL